MRFGVNHTPSRHWFHAWHDFDPDAARRDLDAIAALGLDHVRVMCLWPLFQPNRGMVSERAVGDLLTLVDAAAAAGLDVSVDALQGHLSSFDFYPAWTQTYHAANVFTDPSVVEAQARYLTVLAEALRDRPNVLGLQLGNEPNNLLPQNPASAAQIDAWAERLLGAVAATLPGRLATQSAHDAVWYDDGHPFTPASLATRGTHTVVHPWVFSAHCAERYGPLAFQSTHLAEYVVALARAYATDPDRQVWVQEVGAPAPLIPAELAPEFARQTLENLAASEALWGVTWWCSHDVDRRLVDFPELEYTLGLLDSAGAAKPIGEQVAATVAELRRHRPAPRAQSTGLVLAEGPDRRSRRAPGGDYFEAWMRRAAEEAPPRVVLAERAGAARDLELVEAG